jgi:hypothetical protein
MSKPDLKDLLSKTNEIDLTVRGTSQVRIYRFWLGLKISYGLYKIMYYLGDRISHSRDFIDYRI